MVEKRLLEFSDEVARYDDDWEIILFRGKSSRDTVYCAISREAIEDHFKPKGGGNAARMAVFKRHRRTIGPLLASARS